MELPRTADFGKLLAALRRAGWSLATRARGAHHRIVSPGGQAVVFPRSPSDWRAIRNFRAEVRRVIKAESNQ